MTTMEYLHADELRLPNSSKTWIKHLGWFSKLLSHFFMPYYTMLALVYPITQAVICDTIQSEYFFNTRLTNSFCLPLPQHCQTNIYNVPCLNALTFLWLNMLMKTFNQLSSLKSSFAWIHSIIVVTCCAKNTVQVMDPKNFSSNWY